PLAIGAEYQADRTFAVPAGVPDGDNQLLVFTDAGATVDEGPHENNNVGAAATPVTVTHLDLSVALVNPPTSLVTGQSFTINWTVTNVGSVSVSGPVYDLVQVRNLDTTVLLISQFFPSTPVN